MIKRGLGHLGTYGLGNLGRGEIHGTVGRNIKTCLTSQRHILKTILVAHALSNTVIKKLYLAQKRASNDR